MESMIVRASVISANQPSLIHPPHRPGHLARVGAGVSTETTIVLASASASA
jgi:hypothetical protein